MKPTRSMRMALVAALLVWPWLHLPTSFVGDAGTAGLYLLVALSLVLLTGWVGQVSLAQASFVGIGAYIAAMVTRGAHLGFPLNLLVGSLAAAAAAAGLGMVALRVRGLYLAVATLIFAWVTDAYLFTARWMGGTGGSTTAPVRTTGTHGGFPFVDFGDRRTFYYIVLAACASVIFVLLNLRDSKLGRAFLAVRGSEIAAASFGVDVVRTKLIAFACSGFIAGMAGALLVVHQGSVVADQFNLTVSLFYLSIAVVGGLSSIGGAVGASLLFAALNQVFFRVQALSGYLEVVSAGLLAGVLLLYPGGLAAGGNALRVRLEPLVTRYVAPAFARLDEVLTTARQAVFARIRRTPSDLDTEAGNADADTGVAVGDAAEPRAMDFDSVFAAATGRDIVTTPLDSPPVSRRERRRTKPRRVDTEPVLKASHVTVRFGGLFANENVSVEVRKGEIVGLIGPNGAGKTTFFNAISGLNKPTSGEVELIGTDCTELPVHRRAALGLARTFQVLQLFPQLSVFENVLVGTHLHSSSALGPRLVMTRGAIEAEIHAVERVEEVLEMLNLSDIAHRSVLGLPFGMLRMVELARAVVTGADLIMLDEPASGLDHVETDRLSDTLRRTRDELGVSMLVIEHDVRMVTALTDYMYVLDRGRLIAEGTPAEIQSDEQVIAAYLGTESQLEEAVS